jgi:ABC-type sugar transport system substrate-binding protein
MGRAEGKFPPVQEKKLPSIQEKSRGVVMKESKRMSRRMSGLASIVLSVALGSIALTGCASSGDPASTTSTGAQASSSATTETFTVGAVIWDMTQPFFAPMAQAMQDTADELGMKVTILSGQNSVPNQVAAIQQFISQGVDLIVVTPSDADAIVPAIKQANDAGIPVIAVNSAVGEGANLVTYVGVDDYEYGVQQANLVIKALGDKGNVAMLEGSPGTVPATKRTAGFKATLANHPDIKIVSEIVDNWSTSENVAGVQDLMAKFGDTLDAVVAQGPQMYAGAKYARDNGWDSVKFIAGDYTTEVETSINNGDIWGTVNQDPVLQGQAAIQYAHEYLAGDKSKIPAPQALIPLTLVTKDNVADFKATWTS